MSFGGTVNPTNNSTMSAIDWGAIANQAIPAVINAGAQIGAGAIIKNNGYGSVPQIPTYGSAVPQNNPYGAQPDLSGILKALGITDAASDIGKETVQKSLTATLKQYWWAFAAAFLAFCVVAYKAFKK